MNWSWSVRWIIAADDDHTDYLHHPQEPSKHVLIHIVCNDEKSHSKGSVRSWESGAMMKRSGKAERGLPARR